MNRLFLNILSGCVEETASFYEDVFGMTRHFDSDWFVILVHKDMPGHELGILDRNSDILPQGGQDKMAGFMITLVVDDCEATFEHAQQAGAAVVEEPRSMPYGQRRALILDPSGAMVDISSPE